jgi:hypothetical protein
LTAASEQRRLLDPKKRRGMGFSETFILPPKQRGSIVFYYGSGTMESGLLQRAIYAPKGNGR